MLKYKDKFAGSQADRLARDVEAADMAEQLKKTKLSGSIFVLSKCCLRSRAHRSNLWLNSLRIM